MNGQIDEALNAVWRDLRDNAAPERMDGVKLVVLHLRNAGFLHPAIAELWSRRLDTCPGHDDEGGRDWCAYCGTLPVVQEPDTEETP